jgi:predicted nucleotidyltransferase
MAFRDYEEFIAALNSQRARYLIVGAHAVAFHAQPRATKDLDVLIDPAEGNARRTLDALRDFFGGTDLGYRVDDLTDPRWIVQLGVAPVRIDLHAGLAGLPNFEEAWGRRVDARFGSVDTHYLGLDDLIRVKEAANREQDRADVVVLRRVRGKE